MISKLYNTEYQIDYHFRVCSRYSLVHYSQPQPLCSHSAMVPLPSDCGPFVSLQIFMNFIRIKGTINMICLLSSSAYNTIDHCSSPVHTSFNSPLRERGFQFLLLPLLLAICCLLLRKETHIHGMRQDTQDPGARASTQSPSPAAAAESSYSCI